MSHAFIHQPDAAGFGLRDAFAKFAALSGLQSLDIVVAWARRTGIRAVRDCVQSMCDAGVDVRAIIGISQGGTSRQALSDALELFSETWIYHVPGKTFHPKVYLAKADNRAIALVGSHNLTLGGAANNFEAGILSDLDLAVPNDRAFYMQVADFVERLRNDEKVCRKLDDSLLSQLTASSSYRLDDEDDQIRIRTGEPTEDEISDEDGVDSEELFSSSSIELRWIRGRLRGARESGSHKQSPRNDESDLGNSDRGSNDERLISRWYKTLGKIDAQQPGAGHPSNTMTLVQAKHDIDHTTYFRDTFFQGAHWEESATKSGKSREVARVKFEVLLDEIDMGEHIFEIRHTPAYDSGQGNRTTELVWDKSLGTHLHGHDLTGQIVSLEKYSDERYRLIIALEPSGEFVK